MHLVVSGVAAVAVAADRHVRAVYLSAHLGLVAEAVVAQEVVLSVASVAMAVKRCSLRWLRVQPMTVLLVSVGHLVPEVMVGLHVALIARAGLVVLAEILVRPAQTLVLGSLVDQAVRQYNIMG
jgi:hypothetical protein